MCLFIMTQFSIHWHLGNKTVQMTKLYLL